MQHQRTSEEATESRKTISKILFYIIYVHELLILCAIVLLVLCLFLNLFYLFCEFLFKIGFFFLEKVCVCVQIVLRTRLISLRGEECNRAII